MARPPYAGWEPCPPGELQHLAARLSKRRRRRLFLRGAAAAALASAGGALAWWIGAGAVHDLGPVKPGDFTYGGISCTRVKSEATAYGNGDVDPAVRRRIVQHLAQCPPCRAHYQARGLNAHAPGVDGNGSGLS